ncbi:MAG: hypothetical protein VW338_03550 [Rhodospirillaceae bacterium]
MASIIAGAVAMGGGEATVFGTLAEFAAHYVGSDYCILDLCVPDSDRESTLTWVAQHMDRERTMLVSGDTAGVAAGWEALDKCEDNVVQEVKEWLEAK